MGYTGSNASNSFAASSGTAAMSASVVSGNLIIVNTARASGGTATMSKSAGTATIGTITQIGTDQLTGTGGTISVFAIPVTGSGTLTLQMAASTSGFNGFTAIEWSSDLTTTQDGTPPAKKVTSITNAGGTFTGNAITTTHANSVVFGYMTNDGGNATWNFSAASGWSIVGDGAVTGNPSWILFAAEASAGSYAPSSTWTGGGTSGSQLMYTVALQTSGGATDPFPAGYQWRQQIDNNAIFRM